MKPPHLMTIEDRILVLRHFKADCLFRMTNCIDHPELYNSNASSPDWWKSLADDYDRKIDELLAQKKTQAQ